MLKETGEVISITEGTAKIEMHEGGTDSCKSCGLCNSDNQGHRYIEIPTLPDLKPGQRVYVSVNPKARTLAAIVLFLIPLVIFLGGLTFFYWVFGASPEDDKLVLYSMIGGGLCAVFYYLVFYILNKSLNWNEKLKPFHVESIGKNLSFSDHNNYG